ncbi:MAG TPA: inositol monophosphatase family protein [Polyangiaceae bacterium]
MAAAPRSTINCTSDMSSNAGSKALQFASTGVSSYTAQHGRSSPACHIPGHSRYSTEYGSGDPRRAAVCSSSPCATARVGGNDPLDGTVNYAHGVPIFCVSIAYAYRGRTLFGAVYDPMRDEMFSAERGKGAKLNHRPLQVTQVEELQQSLMVTGFPYDSWNSVPSNFYFFEKLGRMTQGVRRLGSAAIDLCYVAAGRLDGYWEVSLNAWDIAAAGLIAEEAGALVTNFKGEAEYLASPVSVVAANPVLHARLLEQLR